MGGEGSMVGRISEKVRFEVKVIKAIQTMLCCEVMYMLNESHVFRTGMFHSLTFTVCHTHART